MIPILIGANGSFNRSPRVPLSASVRYRVSVVGLVDTLLAYSTTNDDVMTLGNELVDGLEVSDSQSIMVINKKNGTERTGSIFISISPISV